MNLKAVYRFVLEHGFRAELTHVVTFWVPYTNGADVAGEDRYVVRTMEEARNALGY